MKLSLIMLGTGNAFAKKNFNNNALFQADSYQLLIDCGITAPLSLHNLNLLPSDLDGILITHIHGDHVGGLEEIGFQMKYRFQSKLKLFIPEPLVEPLWNETLKGTMGGGTVTLEDYYDVIPIPVGQPYVIHDSLQIEAIQTEHVPNKLSYSIFINKFLFYSSDTVFNPKLLREIADIKKCKYILHECDFVEQSEVHTTLYELQSLPKHIQKKIYLMHYGDEKEKYDSLVHPMKFLEQHQKYTFSFS